MTTTVKIVTWNVNSIKARLHAVPDWIREHKPDILLLQELKCLEENFPYEVFEDLGFNIAIKGQKSYNGVAILSKFPLDDVIKELPLLNDNDEADEQARYIEALAYIDDKVLRVASVYVPNGTEVDSDRFHYKLNFFDRMTQHSQQLQSDDTPFIIGGDYNVAPEDVDVYNPASLKGSICFHPKEQEKYRALIYSGLTELYRAHHPESQQFTWWDYRGGGYKSGKGMRIDFLLASPDCADKSLTCDVEETARSGEKASDHAPVWCEIAL